MELLRPRILVIEPDASIRALLAAIARRRGFAVETAGSRDEALQCAHSWPYAAIILEPRMPGGDALLRELAADKLIVTTASAEVEPSSAVAVLRKPFLIDELSSVIDGYWPASA